jgi:hypothetical protein
MGPMGATVFFSWQADTPTGIGRNFLRKALEDACAAIASDAAVSDADRDLIVDSDTQGVAGHPPIVETIFKKIDGARVFVADMTLVAKRPDGGASPNPNVLIEYGWALKSLTHQQIICVMNAAYGEPSSEALPFDLRHMRWPFRYELAETVTTEVRAEQRKKLTRHLTDAIRACLGSAPAASPQRSRLTDLREWAVAAGWCSDVRSATIGDNDWWTFATRLRQAAADGSVEFSGRRYVYDFGKDLDTEPLVKIPTDHFVDFEFDPTALAQLDNYELFTGKIGESPSAWKGRIFRDLHVNADQARAWLAGAGRPPPSAEIAVRIKTAGAKIDDFRPVCALVLANTGDKEFERCLVQMTEFSGVLPDGMPLPFTLRTDSQIRNDQRDSFSLLARQETMIPLAFHAPKGENEWFLFDENGQRYFIPANPMKMLLHIYGGAAPGSALAFIDTDAGWNALPSVQTVPKDFTLKAPGDAAVIAKAETAHSFFAPELARIFARQVWVLGRVIPNFIMTSTKQNPPGDTWASLKPWRPQLYPEAPKFHELPAADATSLVKFYDSLQEISDILDSWVDGQTTTDVNAWNVVMQKLRNNLTIGEEAVRRFCPDWQYSADSPASGTLLHQSERARAAAQAALAAHLKRHGVS